MHCHPSFDNILSGGPTGFPLKKEPQIGGASLTVWRIGRRNRAGAGAGATPVSVARSATIPFSLAESRSWVAPAAAPPSRSQIRMRFAVKTTVMSNELVSTGASHSSLAKTSHSACGVPAR